MHMKKPEIGDIVIYCFTQANVDHAAELSMGYKLGDDAPLIVTWVNGPSSKWGEGTVNGQVFCDGPEVLHVQGLKYGYAPGMWHFKES